MKITFNNYMIGYNNTIYSSSTRNNHNVTIVTKEAQNEPVKNTVKNSTNNKVVHQNLVNTEINLENNMLYYYRSQELKRRRDETKEEKVTKVPEL